MLKILREEEGSTITLLAIMSMALLGIMALVVDYGMLTVINQRLENKVDTVVLAAAQELDVGQSAADAKAREYALKNDLDLANTSINIDTDSVKVSTHKTIKLLFARVFNKFNSEMIVSAKANLAPIGATKGIIPLGIRDQELEYGTKVVLKEGSNATDISLGSGNYGILQLTGPGASDFSHDLRNGYDGWMHVGDIISTESGDVSGKTKEGIEYRIASCTHNPKCTPTNFVRDCPRVVSVPVYIDNTLSSQSVVDVKIVGFAAFFLDSYAGNGNESFVYGYFVHRIAQGDIQDGAKDFGQSVVRLVKE